LRTCSFNALEILQEEPDGVLVNGGREYRQDDASGITANSIEGPGAFISHPLRVESSRGKDDDEDGTVAQLGFDNLHQLARIHVLLVVPDIRASAPQRANERTTEGIVLVTMTDKDLQRRHGVLLVRYGTSSISEHQSTEQLYMPV
jgi:hypothetical protein